jgi:Tol biopolymer transport system component
MTFWRKNALTLSLILVLALTACTSAAAPTVRPTFEFRFRSTPTATPEPTQTPAPSATAQPSPTPTLAPPATLSGKITYVQGNAVWVQDLASGQKTRVTPQLSGFQSPAWSSSGNWLAFLIGTELWKVGADGKGFDAVARGVSVHAFAWSPTTDELAYVTGDAELWLAQIGPSASKPVRLISSKGGPVSGVRVEGLPYWSPDGSQIAVAVDNPTGSGGAQYAGLWVVDAKDGANPREVYSAGTPPPYGVALAGWTPDGKSLLYWPNPAFSASLAADGQVMSIAPLAQSSGLPKQVGPTLEQPGVWDGTKDGAYIAIMSGYGRQTWENKQIQVYSTEDGSRWTASAPGVIGLYPRFSPDGQWLAYVGGADLGDVAAVTNPLEFGRHLWLADLKGNQQRQLTNDANYSDGPATWMPDGEILFPRMTADGTVSIWALWPWEAGQQPTKLVDGLSLPGGRFGYYGYVDWSTAFSFWPGSAAQK